MPGLLLMYVIIMSLKAATGTKLSKTIKNQFQRERASTSNDLFFPVRLIHSILPSFLIPIVAGWIFVLIKIQKCRYCLTLLKCSIECWQEDAKFCSVSWQNLHMPTYTYISLCHKAKEVFFNLVFTADARTSASTRASNKDNPSGNEIGRKHKYKWTHPSIPNCLGAR